MTMTGMIVMIGFWVVVLVIAVASLRFNVNALSERVGCEPQFLSTACVTYTPTPEAGR